MMKKDIDSRKYALDSEGFRWVKRNSVADTIRSGLLTEQESTSPPVDSIVALDVADITKAQREIFMKGTPNIATACFNQFLSDVVKTNSSEGHLDSGRIVYTVSIDLGKAQLWRDTAEGKDYLENLLKKERS